LITAILRSGSNANMLFYGSPGTGKTEFARSIVKEAGREAWLLQYNDGRNLRRRFEDFRTACALMPAGTGVLIVDEADGLLNTVNRFFFASGEETDKGLLNTLLDGHGKKVIWICNRTGGMEESTLRRFSYSLSFGKNTIKQRQRYWNTLVRAHRLEGLLKEAEIAKLARQYEINVGHIAYALEAWDALNGQAEEGGTPHPTAGLAGKGSLSPLDALRDILDRQQELLGKGSMAARPVHCSHDLFDPAFLNTEPGIGAMVRAVSGASVSNGAHFLFYGPPGTGKSECARHLAAVMDREFIAKRTSDIMSPYVGENERNIRDIFAEAEDAVLCLDEADSFFRDRGRAGQSWEVSFTNEFLTQMESFKGVLVCSTNFLDLLDGAVLRRFAWKVRFLSLRKEQRAELVRRYFGFEDLTGEEKQLFTAIDDLTAGDIRAVRLRYGDVCASGVAGGMDYNTRQLLLRDIVWALAEECRLRTKDSPVFAGSGKKSIGFTA
ncbi:MAG: ATP-binding protein, partial [Spirochaetales bacterium]